VSGAGKYSVDEQILGGELKIYQVLSTRSSAAAIRIDIERRTSQANLNFQECNENIFCSESGLSHKHEAV